MIISEDTKWNPYTNRGTQYYFNALGAEFYKSARNKQTKDSLRCVHAQEIIEVLKEDRSLSETGKATSSEGVCQLPSNCKFNMDDHTFENWSESKML